MAPWAKVGGLADVVTGLSKACVARGHKVEVLLPHYALPGGDTAALTQQTSDRVFDVPFGRVHDGEPQVQTVRTQATSAVLEGVPVTLLRPSGEGDLAKRMFRGPYGSQGGMDELSSSLYFCRAALEWLCQTGRRPDIIHLHEWQCSAASMLYWDTFSGCLGSRIVLTIHNADSPGECRTDQFWASGTDGLPFSTLERALDERTIGHNPERLSLLKGGIVYANAVTTVSRTYRDETLRAGGWLGGVLGLNASKYKGVVNGIDTSVWNPAADPALPFPYSAEEMGGKAQCKAWVQRGLGLPEEPDTPLLIAVTRLVNQKGPGLLLHCAHRCAALGYQFVLLGTGAQDGSFRRLAADDAAAAGVGTAPPRRLLLFYSEPLAHLLFAAADVTLVPSTFEPCGLTQMVGQRYGAVPLVRRTGGLADTVSEGVTGFLFDSANDERAFEECLVRALTLYRAGDGGKAWNALVQRCMSADLSWLRASSEYLDMYAGLHA